MEERDNENKFVDSIIDFFKRVKNHNIGEYTAQCAYYTILSFIPFIIILLTLIQYTDIDQTTLLAVIKAFIPNIMNEKVLNIVQEIYSKSFGTISISIIVVLWSAGNGFFALCKGFHVVYEIPKKRTYLYFKLKGIVSTLIFILVIVLALILSVFGNYIVQKLSTQYQSVADALQGIINIGNVGLTAFLFVIFLLMYKYIPNHKVKMKNQIPGALFASIAWSAVSYAFGMYINVFTGFSLMYGSLTTVILTMMWVYTSMYVILLGAEINAMYTKSKKVKTKKGE